MKLLNLCYPLQMHLGRTVQKARPVQVLVHAAAGGVGQAAVHVITAAGGRVVATAGGPEKRVAVRAMGIRAVANSRDIGFVELLGCGGPAGARPLSGPAIASETMHCYYTHNVFRRLVVTLTLHGMSQDSGACYGVGDSLV